MCVAFIVLGNMYYFPLEEEGVCNNGAYTYTYLPTYIPEKKRDKEREREISIPHFWEIAFWE